MLRRKKGRFFDLASPTVHVGYQPGQPIHPPRECRPHERVKATPIPRLCIPAEAELLYGLERSLATTLQKGVFAFSQYLKTAPWALGTARV